MKSKVSDLIVRYLEERGVDHIFLLSGGMMMHLLDSVSKSKRIKYICNHHEQACAMAAEGNARWRGGLGVCFATSGPGATNTVTGIAGAWLDSTPLLTITGQSRRTLTTRGLGLKGARMVGTFEVDILPIVDSITKYAVFIDDPLKVIYHLEKAVHLAVSGRPGPVLLDIPLDVQGAIVDEQELHHFSPEPVKTTEHKNFSALWEKLATAKRPVFLAGHGIRVAGESARFLEFIRSLGIPLVTTQLANDLVPYELENYIGHVGLRGDRAANYTIQLADLIIILGSSLHITTTGYDTDKFAPSATKIWIDLDASNLSRNILQAEFCYEKSVTEFLNAVKNTKICLAPCLSSWNKLTSKWKKSLSVISEHPVQEDRINTYQLVDILSNQLNGGEVVVTDAGSLYYIVGQCFRSKKGQRVVVSGALGSMGYALPASIGIAVDNPNGVTICLTGDGSMQMNVQELATVSQYAPNLKIIVINNGGYASIRNTQTTFCSGNIAATDPKTGVGLPRWEDLCVAYGILYKCCKLHSELADTVNTVISTPGPIFMECFMDENVEMHPAVASVKKDDGSFVTSRLHEMSPMLSPEKISDLGINEKMLSYMRGEESASNVY